MTPSGNRSAPAAPSMLEAELRRIAREEAQAALRAAIRDLPGSRPEWTTIARYARSCGLGYATLRRWARAAGLKRGPAGRLRTADLDAVVARGGKPIPVELPVDLATRRARAALDSLKGSST